MFARCLARGIGGLIAACTLMASAEAATTMAVHTNGHGVEALVPGARISVTVRGLATTRQGYCLGLASAIDRYGLPANLGRITREPDGTGRIVATIPLRLLPAEPAGPYLLFVGTCTAVAPDRPFVARTMIRIVPAQGGGTR